MNSDLGEIHTSKRELSTQKLKESTTGLRTPKRLPASLFSLKMPLLESPYTEIHPVHDAICSLPIISAHAS